MILVGLAATAWFGSMLAQTRAELWWLVLALGFPLAWLLRRSGLAFAKVAGLVVVALSIGALPLLTNQVNPNLVSSAGRFEEQNITAQLSLRDGSFQAKGKIAEPSWLAGNGWFQVTGSTSSRVNSLGCIQVVVTGIARLVPPSNATDAQNQFRASFSQIKSAKCLNQGALSTVSSVTAWTQERARQAATGISSPASALVLGLTNGDDSGLSDSVKQKMKLLSLTHLTAVSGTNCTIVVLAIFFVAGAAGLGRRARSITAALGLVGYLLLVGPEPSVLRASAMSAIGLFALIGGRQKAGLGFLGLAVLILLAVDPTLALSLGFALSAAATFSVIWLAPKLGEKLSALFPTWLATLVSATIAAQLCCLPILVTLQSDFSLLAVLANVVVEPLVPGITVLGVTGAVLALIWPPLGAPLFWVASVPAQAILGLANWFASVNLVQSLPGQLIGIGFTVLLLVATLLWVQDRPRTATVGALLLMLLLLGLGVVDLRAGIQASRFGSGNWVYVACDVGQGDATVIRSNQQVAVIDVGPEPEPIDRCLRTLGIHKIDLLVLSHFDRDHVGGLTGAVHDRRVDLGLVTQFPDERPAASYFTTLLERAARQVIAAERGLTGTLGEFQWRVLSPHHDGDDSEDSNDGSVTMSFEAPKFWILTLADLGEKGQMRLVQERGSWYWPRLTAKPLILKVSHHGSADEYSEFMHWLKPTIATISVGEGNSYGHPTQRLLNDLNQPQATVLRTDRLGSISVIDDSNRGLAWAASSAR